MPINHVFLEGRLTRDPEKKVTPNANVVVSFGIAQNHKSGDKEYTHYFECFKYCSSDKQEAYFMGLQKGQLVVIDGELRYSSWITNGQKRSKVEVLVREIRPYPPRDAQRADAPHSVPQAPIPTASVPPAAPAEVYDEDIPF